MGNAIVSAPWRAHMARAEFQVGASTATASPGSTNASNINASACAAPHVTIDSVAIHGSTGGDPRTFGEDVAQPDEAGGDAVVAGAAVLQRIDELLAKDFLAQANEVVDRKQFGIRKPRLEEIAHAFGRRVIARLRVRGRKRQEPLELAARQSRAVHLISTRRSAPPSRCTPMSVLATSNTPP